MKLMQNFNENGRQDGANDIVTSVICSMGLLICMVFAVLGIKFKWFKHRLSFDQIPGTSARENSSASENGTVVPLQGIFRRKEDADSFVEIERPKTLPPVRVRSSDVQIPIPTRQFQPSLPSANAQNSQPPTPPPMPGSSNMTQRSENRSQKSNRSQASSRSKSSERGKRSDKSDRSERSDDQSTSTSKSSSSRKKKGLEESKSKSPSTSATSHYSEVNKKRRDKDKEKGRSPPSGATFEPKARPRSVPAGAHSDQTRHFEKLKDDKQTTKGDRGSRIVERRPTGFVRPNDEEMEALEKIMDNHYQIDGFSDNDEENQQIFEKVKAVPVPEPRKRTSSEATSPSSPMSPPIASVAGKPSDSWSAVARHRILTEELTKQHSALKPVGMDMRSNGMSEFRNPLSSTQTAESKPRTMRDMKKSKEMSATASSHSDRVVLGQEQQRDDTEA